MTLESEDCKMTLEKNPAIGSSWDDLQKTIFTKEEIEASELRVALMLEIIDSPKRNLKN